MLGVVPSERPIPIMGIGKGPELLTDKLFIGGFILSKSEGCLDIEYGLYF